MYIVDSGVSLHVMEANSFTSQQKKLLEIQTAFGIIRSTQERRFTSKSWWHIILEY